LLQQFQVQGRQGRRKYGIQKGFGEPATEFGGVIEHIQFVSTVRGTLNLLLPSVIVSAKLLFGFLCGKMTIPVFALQKKKKFSI
jgi:hypothetical protein